MIKVLFFGAIVEILDKRECLLPVSDRMTLDDVVRAVGCGDIHPLLVAVNQVQADSMSMPIIAGDEIAIMPPFSGG